MTSTFDIIKRVHEQHRSLVPNLTTLGYFEDKLQMIALPSITRNDFNRAFEAQDANSCVQVHPLLAHELRHWFDYVGTLWGQTRLINFFNAINARENDDPNHFAPIVKYFRDIKKVFLLDYFTTVTNDPKILSSKERWKYKISCGHRFEADGSMSKKRNLFFAKFETQDNKFVSRTPLSVASLLETGAISAELDADMAILKTVPEENRPSFEQKHISHRYNFIYSPEMTVYSIAAHFTSTILAIGEPLPTFMIAASLAHISLNLPESLYPKIQTPEALKQFGEANDNLKEECDPTYAFLSLLYHSATLQNNPNDTQTDRFTLAGLPTPIDIERSVVTEMYRLRENIVKGPFYKYLIALLDYGMAVFQARGLLGNKLLPLMAILEGRFIPPIMLLDYGPFTLSEDDEIWKDCDVRWVITKKILGDMQEFEKVCGV